MKITAKIFRYDPESGVDPCFREYTVDVNKGARVLNVLIAIREQVDSTISFRYCCSAGQCGSCAVRVNGEPVLACMTEASDGMLIEPLKLPVIKDLMVDLQSSLKDMPGLVPCGCPDLPTRDEIEKIKEIRDCIECLSCVSECPAVDVTDFLGPTVMRQEMRLALDSRDHRDRIPDTVREGLFTCTSCSRCVEVCPKDIRIPGKAIEKLRELANREGLTLPRHLEVADFVRTIGKSVTRIKTSFLEQVPEFVEAYGEVKAEIGFFVGCMYDLRLPDTALDAIEVMRRNGVSLIIPKEQVCCGSPLIRTGQTSFLEELKKKNIECFKKRGIEIVMTMCAGCGATLKNDYDTPFRVMDINEVLNIYGIDPPEKLDYRITYHDPCHLLRGQGISEEPRKLIELFTDDFVEMPSRCCGSGGGVKSGLPEEAAELGRQRDEEIKKTGCEIVVSSCPFCEFHIQSCTDTPVKNITTLLLEGYRKKESKTVPESDK